MHTRRWLTRVGIALGALTLALFVVPLPSSCDPRLEEIPDARWAELAGFAGSLTRAEVERALREVDPEGQLQPHYTLDDRALEVRPGGNATGAVRIALRPAASAPPPAPGARSLRGLRIALDPGHHGGAWSLREKRHTRRAGGPVVREGDLAWATARLVERELAAAGAEVRLLRGPPPTADYPAGADPRFDLQREAAYRLAEQRPVLSGARYQPPWLTPVAALELAQQRRQLMADTPFELYTRFDLRRRAELAQAFAPDLTLSIHWDYSEADRNGILVFVPGNFVGPDLATSSQRFWAFRRALDGTLAESQRLGRAFAAALMKHFQLPALGADHDRETGGNWRAVDPALGLFARNLAISRRAPGVVLLLEGPCVNQTEEYPRLITADLEVDGRRYPARVEPYARAVLEVLRAETR